MIFAMHPEVKIALGFLMFVFTLVFCVAVVRAPLTRHARVRVKNKDKI